MAQLETVAAHRRNHTNLIRALAALGALALAFLFAIANPPSAKADATGCSYYGAVGPVKGMPTYNGQYCFSVGGDGNYVTGGGMSFVSAGNTCNWNVTMEFFDSQGNWYTTIDGPTHYTCDHAAGDSLAAGTYYLSGTVCSTLKTNGARLTSVCHNIYP